MILKKNKQKKEKKQTNLEIGTLYDVNKNLIEKNIKTLTEEELNKKRELIISFLNNTKNNYYMLLCNEKKDYTVFHRNKNNRGEFWDLCEGHVGDSLDKVLIQECLPNRGEVKSIELTEDKEAIEIWLSIDGESYCYYFFPYSEAVIEC